MAEGYTHEEFTGTVTEVTSDFMLVQETGRPNPRKIWKGRLYAGPPPPPVGTLVVVAAARAPAKPPNKFGSLYLDAWQIATAPQGASQAPQNGSQSPPPTQEKPKFVGRDPGIADYFLATRWAWSLAAEILAKTGREPSVDAIKVLAGEVFQAAYSECLNNIDWIASLEGKAP